MANDNYKYPEILITDFIDESLEKILDRDEASRIGFRKDGSFPIVDDATDIGFEVYKPDLGGKFRYLGQGTWKQIDKADTGTTITSEEAAERFEPKNSKLTSLSATAGTAKTIPFFASTGIIQLQPITDFVRNLFTKSNKDTVRKELGIGNVASLNLPIHGSNIASKSITSEQLDLSSIGLWVTGDIKTTFQPVAPAGWLILNEGSIGSPTSGATLRANEDVKDLYKLFWKIPVCTLQTLSGYDVDKGSTADLDWQNNRRLLVPETLGRVLAQATTGHAIGSVEGIRDVTLTEAQMPKHTHGIRTMYVTLKTGGGWPGLEQIAVNISGDNYKPQTAGSGQAHPNMQPTTYVNFMVKL